MASPFTAWAGDRVAPSGKFIHDELAGSSGGYCGVGTHTLLGAAGQAVVGRSQPMPANGIVNHGWPTLDVTPPNAVCQDITRTLPGPITVTAEEIDGGSTDNVGITTRTIDGGASQVYTSGDVGANPATLLVGDAAGNTDTCIATVTIVKGSSTITATGAPSFTYSGNPQGPDTANGTGSTGAVTYSYSGAGSTSYGPSATKPTNAGTYLVVASVAEDANYNGAASAPLAFTITAKPITVTADAKNKAYGQSDPALTHAVTSGGLEPGDAITGDLTREAGENIGTYEIQQGTLTANSNYNMTYVPANLTITAKPITVTADAKNKVYGQSDPALTYEVTSGGLEPGDSITGDLTREAGNNAGTYEIQQGTLTAGSNYSITYVPADLTIGRATVTVTLVDAIKLWDGGTAVTLTPANFSPQDLVSGESLVISQTTGTFSSPNLGVDIPVSAVLTGFIEAGPGTDLDNYDLPATANGLGTITDILIPVVTWPSASAIVYGQALSTSTLSGASATDPITSAPVSGTFAFDDDTIVPAAGSYSADLTFTPTLTAVYASRQTQIPVEVQKAPATVTLDSLSQTYDGLPKEVTATTDPPGLTVNFTYDSLPTAPTNAGSYAVVGTVDDPNYQGSASGMLTIAQAAITVTADAKTKDESTPDPALTYQVTSGALAPGDSLSGALTRQPGETAGTYAILQGTLTAGPNYDLTYVSADLVIMGPPFEVLYTGPNPVVVRVNERVDITVEAVNYTGDVTYQWYRVDGKAPGILIPGAEEPTLVIPQAGLDDAGVYLCEATWGSEVVWSPYIELQVEDAPGLPVTGLTGLAALLALLGATGTRLMRRSTAKK